MGLLDKLFTSEAEKRKAEEERLENEKFDIQIKTRLKINALEKEVAQNDKTAQDCYNKAEKFKAAGNKDQALEAYGDYCFARALRRTVKKSLRMMQQVTTMVKIGNLTTDLFSLLKVGLESSEFNPASIQKVIAGNERLKEQFDIISGMMPEEYDAGELSAETWYAGGDKEAETPNGPTKLTGVDKMKAAYEKATRG